MSKEVLICPNCETPHADSDKFCPECGQDSKEKISFKILFQNTIHTYLTVDGRLYRSIYHLLIKPGYLTVEFLKGRRNQYMHPAKLYIFISFVYFIFLGFSTKEQSQKIENALDKLISHQQDSTITSIQLESDSSIIVDSIEQVDKETDLSPFRISINTSDSTTEETIDHLSIPEINDLIRKGASDEELLKRLGIDNHPWISRYFATKLLHLYILKGKGIVDTFFHAISLSIFLLIPTFALILKFLYFKRRYVEHIVHSFHFFSFVFFCFFIFLVLIFFQVTIKPFVLTILTYMVVYLIWSLKKVYNSSVIESVCKGFFLILFTNILLIPIGIASVIGLIFILYQ